LESINHWTGGQKRKMMNLFVNIVHDDVEGSGSDEGILSPITIPYSPSKFRPDVLFPTEGRSGICDLIEDAILVDIVIRRKEISMTVEGSGIYLSEELASGLATVWSNRVCEALAVS